MLKVTSKKKGLTLIEVVISLAILVIIIPPILSTILTSVKTNKRAENEQQALYVAQQCIEEIKSEPIEKILKYESGKNKREIGNFKIEETVTADSNYYFSDSKPKDDVKDEGEKIDFKDIKYDGKIIVKDDNKLEVFNSYSKFPFWSITYKEKNTIEIINGKDKDGKINFEKILAKVNGEPIDITKDKEKKDSFIIEIDILKNDLKHGDFNIKVYNYSSYKEDSFDLYLIRNKNSDFNYNFLNELGKVKFYSNIYKNSDESKGRIGKTRLYKINIKVWEKGQNVSSDNPIKELNAYKTALE